MSNIRQWLDMQDKVIDIKAMQAYRQQLTSQYAVSSVNLKIISVNRYLRWMGYENLTLMSERVQASSSLERVITGNDYWRMLKYAEDTGRSKMRCLMRTIALTGIRVSELEYITVEAVMQGSAEVCNKGKYRCIYLPPKLCEELMEYIHQESIAKGVVFYGRQNGKVITASGVWRNLRYIACHAGVPLENVFPHSFRHLFAKTYMNQIGDITELSDLLGHTRLETTRIYTRTTADEKRGRLEKIGL